MTHIRKKQYSWAQVAQTCHPAHRRLSQEDCHELVRATWATYWHQASQGVLSQKQTTNKKGKKNSALLAHPDSPVRPRSPEELGPESALSAGGGSGTAGGHAHVGQPGLSCPAIECLETQDSVTLKALAKQANSAPKYRSRPSG